MTDRLLIGFVILVMLAILWNAYKEWRTERGRCIVCKGGRASLMPGGRPDADLCERHFQEAWRRWEDD